MNFENKDRTIKVYDQILESIGAKGDRPIKPALTFENFIDESSVYVFTRAPDLVHGENHNVQQSANLTAKIRFGKALPNAVMMVCMAEYDSVIRINGQNNVITDYPV